MRWFETITRKGTRESICAAENCDSWAWGDVHTIEFEDALSKKLGHAPFNIGPFPAPGMSSAVNLSAVSL